jgi:2-dehydro-3-deoxyphosphooctonate aldolase (KDO 8-P synthase)
VNLKKGQFMAPEDMRLAVEKISAGGGRAFVTERGTSFGYHDLVVDMRGLVRMRAFAPVCFDATHAVQQPGANGDATGGEREMVAPLARAAVAVGVDALFVEVHPEPERAPCDAASQLDPAGFEVLLGQLRSIESALR